MISQVWLYTKDGWEQYRGTTSVRKLFYRALEAQRQGSKSFFVHEYPHRSISGARFPDDTHRHTSITSINGVAIEDIPKEIHLKSGHQPFWDFMRDGLTYQQRAARAAALRAQEQARKALAERPGWDVYLAGSLRNPAIPGIAKAIARGIDSPKVFCDWYAAGPEADDHWKAFYEGMHYTYVEALKEPASVNTFEFDKRHIDQSRVMVLALPAGKSGHLELGYFIGKGKPGYILLDSDEDRWDVMYQFATGVTADRDELNDWIRKDLA